MTYLDEIYEFLFRIIYSAVAFAQIVVRGLPVLVHRLVGTHTILYAILAINREIKGFSVLYVKELTELQPTGKWSNVIYATSECIILADMSMNRRMKIYLA